MTIDYLFHSLPLLGLFIWQTIRLARLRARTAKRCEKLTALVEELQVKLRLAGVIPPPTTPTEFRLQRRPAEERTFSLPDHKRTLEIHRTEDPIP